MQRSSKKNRQKTKAKSGLLERVCLAFFDHTKLSVFFWLSIFLFGLFSYTTFMQRQGFPQVSVPISIIRAVYFVDDKNIVDKNVTAPIIEAVQADPSVKTSTANTTGNSAVIVIQHKDTFTSESGSASVQSSIESSDVKLPPNANIAYQSIDAAKLNNKFDILISVSAPDASPEKLTQIADKVGAELQNNLSEVSSAETISPIIEGLNPATGNVERKQTQFDWFGTHVGDEFTVNPSVVVGVSLKEGTDVVTFDKQLHSELETINNKYSSENISVVQAGGFAESIKQQTDSLQKNLLEGLLIVILICLIFIGMRAGITAALAMIATLSLTLGILYVAGITLNTITLFGLVLCLGLIVDDIVIVTESIDAQKRKQKTLREAITVSISKVARASGAGTFTTILGFAPLLFFGGILGKFIKVLPITIIISLLASLVVSLTFVPLLTKLLHVKKAKTNKYSPLTYFRNSIEWLAKTIASVIMSARSTKRKALYSLAALVFSATFLVASGPIYQQLKFDIFPTPKDSNELQIEYIFAPGTSIPEALDITKKSNTIIKETLGENLKKISYQGNATELQATARITLEPYEERATTAKQFVEQLDQSLSSVDGARITVSQLSAGPPKDRLPFVVQINADDSNKADKAATNLVKFLETTPITRPNGTVVNVTETEYTGEQVTITRINGERVVQVKAGFDASDTSAIVQAAQSTVENEFLSNTSNLAGLTADDFGFDFGSETENQDSFKTVLSTLPILLLLMYLLLVTQFKSFVQPILILLAVPFSFFGVGIALNLTGNPISFFTMIGFFALIGISVNNTILLTDYANQGRSQGMSPRQAMASAIHERLRPLLTTTITSVAALIPLALSDPFWESLAITLIGGLLSSAVLVVIAFPYYYLVLEFFRSRIALRFKKQR